MAGQRGRPSERETHMNSERIPVLMYHRVGNAHNEWEHKYCVSPQRFAEHMQVLARAGWQAVTIDDFFAWLDGKVELPEKSFLLTFDDGFLGVHDHAAPVLTALGWPATVFLVSQLIGQRDAWCETHNPSGATYPLMDVSHIRHLRAHGFSFHSHTRSHADLPTLDDSALHSQLMGARDDLQTLLGEAVDYLAYPYGHYDDRVLRAAQAAGYRAAFSVQPGFNRRDIDHFRLRRLDVFGNDSAAALRRKITLGSNDGSLGHTLRYGANRLLTRVGWQHH
jgi:peptidoglycan/xylan/chitin deacetylase (PgdA/CDA1 family)